MDMIAAIKAPMPDGHNVQYIDLNAFNLMPGVTFSTYAPDEEYPIGCWVVMQAHRHIDNEMVWVWARRADLITEGPDEVITQTFMLDFNDQVHMIGLCVNPYDPDDNDWGN